MALGHWICVSKKVQQSFSWVISFSIPESLRGSQVDVAAGVCFVLSKHTEHKSKTQPAGFAHYNANCEDPNIRRWWKILHNPNKCFSKDTGFEKQENKYRRIAGRKKEPVQRHKPKNVFLINSF